MDCGIKLIAGGSLQLIGGGVLEFISQSYCQSDAIVSHGSVRKRRRSQIEWSENYALAEDFSIRKKRGRANEALMVLLH